MNDKLQSQLAEILGSMLTSIGEVKDFSMSQLPDIAQQYITYGIVHGCISTVILLTMSIASGVMAVKMFKKYMGEKRDLYMIAGMASGFVFIITSPMLYIQLNSLILALTAPKVWFILEIKNLIS
jgi:hypothetical protein